MWRFLDDALQMYIIVSAKLVDLYMQKEIDTMKIHALAMYWRRSNFI
jgi:hypothetical protein